MSNPLLTAPADPGTDPRRAAPAAGDGSASSMHQLIQLRWIAVIGQLLTISLVHWGVEIELPLLPMMAVLAALAAFNLGAALHWRKRARAGNQALFRGLLIDVAALTAQLYLSGGIANPFVFLYLLQVVLAAVLLKAWSAWVIVGLTSACLVGLALFPGPVTLPSHPAGGLSGAYILGLLLCFGLIATLLVVFIGRISRNIRARDARLAAMRQRAAEEEYVVRMGLLATGAAHELGTPLATLAVILGDWQHLPHFTSDPELLQDVSEMQAQVLRCKAIVTGILKSAGETRGEATHTTTLRAFLDELLEEWRRSRAVDGFEYRDELEGDVAIVSDAGLQQMLWNVLDNALEASRAHVTMRARLDGDSLVVEVGDDGPGFAADMLDRIGKPYQSTKGTAGRGLGLFLAVNVARTLGGNIRARNAPDGGALVTITLPLPALSLEPEPAEDE